MLVYYRAGIRQITSWEGGVVLLGVCPSGGRAAVLLRPRLGTTWDLLFSSNWHAGTGYPQAFRTWLENLSQD